MFQEMCDFRANVERLYVIPLVSLYQIPDEKQVRLLRFQQRLRRGEGEALTRDFGDGALDVGPTVPVRAPVSAATTAAIAHRRRSQTASLKPEVGCPNQG